MCDETSIAKNGGFRLHPAFKELLISEGKWEEAISRICKKEPNNFSRKWGTRHLSSNEGGQIKSIKRIATIVAKILKIEPHPEFVRNRSQDLNDPLPALIFTRDDLNQLCVEVRYTDGRRSDVWRPGDSTYQRVATSQPDLPVFMMTRWENHSFQGRKHELARIEESFRNSDGPAVIAITGDAGMGKTSTAEKFVHRKHREGKYSKLLWVQADDPESLKRDFVQIARELNLPEQDLEREVARLAVVRWLQSNKEYLLVIDNLDDPSFVTRDFLPPGHQGHILITSRFRNLDDFGIKCYIELDKLDHDQSVELLLGRVQPSELTSKELAAAERIARKLDGLPLALEQAATYIKEEPYSFHDYDILLTRYGLTATVERSEPRLGDSKKRIATTWKISLERVNARNPLSLTLLTVLSFLAPDRIPFEILLSGREQLGDDLSGALGVEDSNGLSRFLAPLSQFSMVKVDPISHSVSLHRLLQEYVRSTLGENQSVWQDRTLRMLVVALRDPVYGVWKDWEKGISHCQEAIQLASDSPSCAPICATLTDRMAGYLYNRGEYSKSKDHYENALEIRLKAFGKKHPNTAVSQNNLAYLLQARGEYEPALTLYKEALIGSRNTEGGTPTFKTARILNNLALLWLAQDSFAEASRCCTEALEIRRRCLGDQDREVAESLNNLGLIYWRQNKQFEGRETLEQALRIHQDVYNDMHPNIGVSLSNLGYIYWCLGQLDEGLRYSKKARKIRKARFGRNHPDTAQSYLNLGVIYSLKCFARGTVLIGAAVKVFQESLPIGHPNIVKAKSALEYFSNTTLTSAVKTPENCTFETFGILKGFLIRDDDSSAVS